MSILTVGSYEYGRTILRKMSFHDWKTRQTYAMGVGVKIIDCSIPHPDTHNSVWNTEERRT